MDVAMYHYVRPAADRPPGGYYRLDLSDFREQLDWFESRYDLLDRDRLVAVFRGEESPPDDGLVLTFDDGLVDHSEWVLPELEARGLTGMFFVSSGALDGTTLPVHRVHALLGSFPAEEVHDALLAELTARDVSDTDDAPVDTYDDAADDALDDRAAAAAAVKRLVNFQLPWRQVPSILDGVETRLSTRTPDPSTFYLTEDDVVDLHDAGMLVGAHTVTHPVLSRLSTDEQRAEIRDSLDRIESLLGSLDVRTFAYPFGGPDTFTDTTKRLLDDAGVDTAFTTVSGSVDEDDTATRPLALERRDCNEFPHGDASFEM